VSTERGWWRENRWWLPALPVAVAAMVVASGYLLQDYWWDTGLHHETAVADQGKAVSVTQDYSDYLGSTRRTYEVKLTGLVQADEVTTDVAAGPQPPGAGQQALVAHLDWKAAPDQSLRGCRVALVDSDGRRYEIVGQAPVDSCTPAGRGGPDVAAIEGEKRGTIPDDEDPRPPTWSTEPVFLVPDGVKIRQVLVWWMTPDYVRLNVS
jgi:hypothetical protein